MIVFKILIFLLRIILGNLLLYKPLLCGIGPHKLSFFHPFPYTHTHYSNTFFSCNFIFFSNIYHPTIKEIFSFSVGWSFFFNLWTNILRRFQLLIIDRKLSLFFSFNLSRIKIGFGFLKKKKTKKKSFQEASKIGIPFALSLKISRPVAKTWDFVNKLSQEVFITNRRFNLSLQNELRK